MIFQAKSEAETDDGKMKLPNLAVDRTYKLSKECCISYVSWLQERVLHLLRIVLIYLQTMKVVWADHRKNEVSSAVYWTYNLILD